MDNRLKEFDMMRALAIFIILIHHLAGHSFNFYNLNFVGINYDLSWLNQLNRYFALGIFFFISGFLINTKREFINTWLDVKTFIIKRYIRIIPLYIIAYFVFIIIFNKLIDNINIFSVIIHLLGLQIIFASKHCDPVMTLWFVGLIISYYYVFAITAKYSKSKSAFWSMIIAFPLTFILVKYFFGFTDKRFILYYSVFTIGIVCEKHKVMENLRWYHTIVATFAVILCMSVYSSFIYPTIYRCEIKPGIFSFVGLQALIISNFIMIAFVFVSYGFSKYLCNKFKDKIYRTIAYASYCMFLFHRPVWWLMTQCYNPTNHIIKLFYLVLIGIPVIILLSYYLQRCYDALINKRALSMAYEKII